MARALDRQVVTAVCRSFFNKTTTHDEILAQCFFPLRRTVSAGVFAMRWSGSSKMNGRLDLHQLNGVAWQQVTSLAPEDDPHRIGRQCTARPPCTDPWNGAAHARPQTEVVLIGVQGAAPTQRYLRCSKVSSALRRPRQGNSHGEGRPTSPDLQGVERSDRNRLSPHEDELVPGVAQDIVADIVPLLRREDAAPAEKVSHEEPVLAREHHRAAQRGQTHIAPLSSHRLGTVSRSVASSNTELPLVRCLPALKVGCECDGLVALPPCDPFGRGTVPSRAATVKARVDKLSSPLNSGRPGCPTSAVDTEQEESSAGERSPDRQPPPPEEKL